MEIAEYAALPLEEQRNLLKQLLSDMVPRGAVKETAFAVGLSDYSLYKMRDPECESHNLIRPELIGIMHQRRDLRLVHFLCGLFRLIAFPLPGADLSLEEIGRHVSLSLRETAAACEAVLSAVDPASDGGAAITYGEYLRLEADIIEAQRQLAALRAAVRRKSEPSWPRRLLARLAAVKLRAGG